MLGLDDVLGVYSIPLCNDVAGGREDSSSLYFDVTIIIIIVTSSLLHSCWPTTFASAAALNVWGANSNVVAVFVDLLLLQSRPPHQPLH